MLKPKENKTELNQSGFSGNPFSGRTDEALILAVTELADIAHGLENLAFTHSGLMPAKRNKDNLLTAYEIGDVLMNCQRCVLLVERAIEDKLAEGPNETAQSDLPNKLLGRGKKVREGIDPSLRRLDSAIRKYKDIYPSNTAPLYTRFAATATIIGGVYALEEYAFGDRPYVKKLLLTGVTFGVGYVGYTDELSTACRAVKGIVAEQQSGEIPFHITATKRMEALLENQNALAPSMVPTRPAEQETSLSTRREILKTCFRLVR